MLYSTAIPIGRRVPALPRTVDITVKAAAVCKNLRRCIGVSDSRTPATRQANTLFFSVVREMGRIWSRLDIPIAVIDIPIAVINDVATDGPDTAFGGWCLTRILECR